MRKETRVQYFLRMFYYWCGRLKLPEIQAIRDNRFVYPCAVWNTDHGTYLLYNEKLIARQPKYVIINYIFHELGHLVHNLPYDSYEEKVISERKAERFALRMMKKHYPKMYQEYTYRARKNRMLEYLKENDKVHYDAWKVIREFIP